MSIKFITDSGSDILAPHDSRLVLGRVSLSISFS